MTLEYIPAGWVISWALGSSCTSVPGMYDKFVSKDVFYMKTDKIQTDTEVVDIEAVDDDAGLENALISGVTPPSPATCTFSGICDSDM